VTIGFIPPVLGVLEDQRVSTAELNWFIQEGMMVIIAAVLMTAFWKIAEGGYRGNSSETY